MKRLVITSSAVVLALSAAPGSALARHHDRRHHSRVHHTRIQRFGSDAAGTPTTTSPADNAGTVQSFQNGVLTIMLTGGSTASGAVTGDTEIECMAPEQPQTVHEDGDNSGSGDDQAQGSGDQSSGDDQGEAAEENENQAEDQNENEAADENENEAENNCSTLNLAAGTVVREAELSISGVGAVWKQVELAP